jgi:hypothetical protein
MSKPVSLYLLCEVIVMKIMSYSSDDLALIREAKEENWPWWDEDGFPAPDPAELARASDFGDPYPFDEFMDEEDLVDA